jgi:hypothetical protein
MYQEKKSETVKRAPSNDEIDLAIVLDRIGAGFSWVFGGISYFFYVLRRRMLLILALIAVGLGIAYLIHANEKPYYTSTMTLMLANIRNEFIEDQLNKLSIMVSEDNVEAISSRLDISPETAKQIREMKFSNLDADRVEEDSILTGSPFRIEMSLYDRNLFDSMEPAITSFLESNRYFAKQKRVKQRQIEQMISKLGGEINSLDSIKTIVSEPRGPVNGFVYGQPIDPTNLFKESINLYKEQVQLEASLEHLDNIEVVTSFEPRLYPTGPSLRKYLAIGAMIAFVIGIVVAFNLESRKRRRQV